MSTFAIRNVPWYLWRSVIALWVLITEVPFYSVAVYVARVVVAITSGYNNGRQNAQYIWRKRS